LELKRFHNEDDLSPIRFSCADEALGEIRNLFFRDQLEEEQIMLYIYSKNMSPSAEVDLNRLNIDRVFSKRQLVRRSPFSRGNLMDTTHLSYDFSIQTILDIKEEQHRLAVEFKNFFALSTQYGKKGEEVEPLLFAQLQGDVFYLLNPAVMKEHKKRSFSVKSTFNWIKNRIFSRTSTKS
jgi:hypothetical protein